MKISGLDAFTRKMNGLQKAVAELDGQIAEVSFDPNDPESIELAICKYNTAVDERVARYAHNEMVFAIAEELKESGRNAILDRAAAIRLEGNKEA